MYKGNFPETNGSVADWWQIWRKMWTPWDFIIIIIIFWYVIVIWYIWKIFKCIIIIIIIILYCFMKPDICRCLTPMHYEAWKKCQHLQQHLQSSFPWLWWLWRQIGVVNETAPLGDFSLARPWMQKCPFCHIRKINKQPHFIILKTINKPILAYY